MNKIFDVLKNRQFASKLNVNKEIFDTFAREVKRNKGSKEEFAKNWIAYCLSCKLNNNNNIHIHQMYRNTSSMFGAKVFTRTGTQLFALGFIYWKSEDAFNSNGKFDTKQFQEWLLKTETIKIDESNTINSSDLLKNLNTDYLNKINLRDSQVILNSYKIFKFDYSKFVNIKKPNISTSNRLNNEHISADAASKLEYILENNFSYSNIENRTITKSDEKYPLVSPNKNLENKDSLQNERKFEKNTFLEILQVLSKGNHYSKVNDKVLEININGFKVLVEKIANNKYNVIVRCNINKSFAKNVPDISNGTFKSVHKNNLLFTVDNGVATDVKHVVAVQKFDDSRYGHDEIRKEKKFYGEKKLGFYINDNGNASVASKIVEVIKSENMNFLVSLGIKNQSDENFRTFLNEKDDEFILQIFIMGLKKANTINSEQIVGDDLNKINDYLNKNGLKPLESYNKIDTSPNKEILKEEMIGLIVKNKHMIPTLSFEISQPIEIQTEKDNKSSESSQNIINEGFKMINVPFSSDKANNLFISQDKTGILKMLFKLSSLITKFQSNVEDTKTKGELLEVISNIEQLYNIIDSNNSDILKDNIIKLKTFIEDKSTFRMGLANISIKQNIRKSIKEIYYEKIFGSDLNIPLNSLKQKIKDYSKLFNINFNKDAYKDKKSFSKEEIIKLMNDPRENIYKKFFYNEYGGKDLNIVLEKHNILKFSEKADIARDFINQITTQFTEVKMSDGKTTINLYSSSSNKTDIKFRGNFTDDSIIYLADYSPIFDIKTKNMLLNKINDNKFETKIIDYTEFEHTFYYRGNGKIKCNEILGHVKNIIKTDSNKSPDTNPLLNFIFENERKQGNKIELSTGRLYKNVEILSAMKLQQNFEIIRTIVDIMLPNMIDYDNYKDNRGFFSKLLQGANKDTLNGITLKGKYSKLNNEIKNLINDLSLNSDKLNKFIEKIHNFK